AGASAGNINSVLTALSYCARPSGDTLHAESSLFWKIWTSVGIEQLVPALQGREEDLAVVDDLSLFSRRFFKESEWREVTDFRAAVTAYPDCRVPVGFSLTQLDTVQYQVAGPVSAPVQRLATVFQVRAAAADEKEYPPGRLGFFPLPNGISYRRSLGAIVLQPELYADSPVPAGALTARDSAMLWAIEAGSAVPPAFAPRWLCYVSPGKRPLLPAESQKASLPETGRVCHRFTDGGVFDNNPLALGLDLAKHGVQLTAADSVWIMFSDPYRLRADASRATRQAEDSTLGIGYLFQLGANAYPAARRYELQSLGRLINRIREASEDQLPGSDPEPVVRISSRGTDIVGTQFGSFGAFLGRPFREYDFYTGVYDGLRVVGESFICAPSGVTSDACAITAQLRLLRENPLLLDPFTLRVARWFAEQEHGTTFVPERLAFTSEERSRLGVLRAIFDALAVPAGTGKAPRCQEPGYLGRQLCSSGFGVLLHQLRAEPYTRIRSAWGNNVGCPQPSDAARGRCFVDASFVRLIEDPENFLDHLVEDLLLRAQMIEDREQDLRESNVARYPYEPKSDAAVYHEAHTRIVRVARAAHRALSAATLRGFQKDPSSVPDRHLGWRARLAHALPYYVIVGEGFPSGRTQDDRESVGPARATPLTLGWQPSRSNGDRHPDNGFTVPLELSYFQVRDTPSDPGRWSTRLGLAAGLGIQFRRSSAVSPGIAMLYTNHLLKEQDPAWRNTTALRLVSEGSVTFAKIFRGSVRWTPLSRSADGYHREFAVQLGIADFNGLLYWILM
ncbi:MAG TPA: hypothetical protein VFM67_01725, partial [Gaiella sp.]|nr:hypothetical protein [Gaiella sp.]